MIKLLYIGNTDLVGKRFNGYYIMETLNKKGIYARMAVYNKESKNPNVIQLKNIVVSLFNKIIRRIEDIASIQSLFYVSYFSLFFLRSFWKANIVHFQLIHTGNFSLFFLPIISRIKKTVWTLHDPWALTGHCVHPFACKRWKVGCGQCPDLNIPIKLKRDNTHLMWVIKKFIYRNSKLDIIVASNFMRKMVEESPLFRKATIHQIPFGIDLTKYKPLDQKKARETFGIPINNFVLLFRSTTSEFKGLNFIREALKKLLDIANISIITLQGKGLINEFADDFQIIELGWIDDEEMLNKIYNACDVFLMPSAAEAFGMMAIEAMACKKVVLVFEGTALPDVIYAKDGGGISIPSDSNKLFELILTLINNPQMRMEIGDKAYSIVQQEYDMNIMYERYANLYTSLINK